MTNKEAIEILSNRLNTYYCTDEDLQALDLAIKALEERPHGKWILISERLPDRFEDVLITYQIPNREPKVRRALYVDGKFNFDNGDVWNWNNPEIKAWMPLPEAYKEAENEEV